MDMDKNHSIIKIEERKRGQHLSAKERGAELQNTPAEVANRAIQSNVKLQPTRRIAVDVIDLERYPGTLTPSIGWNTIKVRNFVNA